MVLKPCASKNSVFMPSGGGIPVMPAPLAKQYQPKGQVTGAPLPSGQAVPAGQGNCWGLIDPAGQKYPCAHAPLQSGVRSIVDPP